MRVISIFFLVVLVSCSSPRESFNKYRTCSNTALKYLKNPRNKEKVFLQSPELRKKMSRTSGEIQRCYEDFRRRSGHKEFNTCLVVGVGKEGELEFYNFDSREVGLDQDFRSCAAAVTKNIPYSKFGRDYILVQTYRFYVTEL